MLITVDDEPNALIELLWIREACNLQPTGFDLPPLLSDTSVGEHPDARASADQIAEWRNAWPALWKACLDHAGRVHDEKLFEELRETPTGSAERAELLRTLVGPDWRDTFGDDAITPKYAAWNRANFEALARGHSRPLNEHPERLSVDSLSAAWRAGLTTVVVVPCVGTFTRDIGPHSLLVTAETRDDPRHYSEALNQFHRARR
ncbi:hypothetical protein D4765_07025 [Subtercola vilae]|uniref:Uncharacterized protein n=2 Tax=Microbacteriaceae TaxID=85023 RepID=A0A4T2C3R6_9MICO|nr:hypothetical protein D4765_07025 [Subtercola vilae]